MKRNVNCIYCKGKASLSMAQNDTYWVDCQDCGAYTDICRGRNAIKRAWNLWYTGNVKLPVH
jgi:hypothetical protein